MADAPMTPEERTRRLARARALILKGGATGMVERETTLMIIGVAETAVLECERLAGEIEYLCKRVVNLRVGLTVIKDIGGRAIADGFLNEVGAKGVLHEILAVIEGVSK